MNRLILASVVTMLASATPALAQGYYSAKPAGELKRASLVTRDSYWRCGDGQCSTSKSNARAAVMCKLAVRQLGPLEAFTAGGVAFTAEDLADCNGQAK